jgi:hypothetical protein
MTLGFAALITVFVIERIDDKIGKTMFFPLLFAGIGSVVYWHFTELSGAGDLRPYLLMQFLPMLMIPIFLFLYPKGSEDKPLWLLMICYVIAKICELEDVAIYQMTLHFVSGHTLKHLFAALGIFLFKPSESIEMDEDSEPQLIRHRP